jgi:hypothetical protein
MSDNDELKKKQQTYIDFMGKVAQVTFEDNKLGFLVSDEITKMYHEKQLEQELMDAPEEVSANNIITKAMEEAYTELYDGYKKGLKELAIKILGINNQWGDWRMDNNGVGAQVATWIADELKKQLKDDLEQIKRIELTATEKKTFQEKVRKNVKDNYRNRYENAFETHFKALVEEKGKADAKRCFERLVKSDTQEDKLILAEMLLGLRRSSRSRW